jgi:hypothetical protein
LLMNMKAKDNKTDLSGRPHRKKGMPGQPAGKEEKNNPSGYPAYPTSEDIYSKYQEEKDIDPEDIAATKASNDDYSVNNEKDFEDDVTGSDLDIPGTELDDNQEDIGSEDEENNYYSLGGDDHNDLEEDN